MEKQKKSTEIARYTKEQLVRSNKFKEYKDILNALLSPAASYTAEEAEKLINTFLKKERKN